MKREDYKSDKDRFHEGFLMAHNKRLFLREEIENSDTLQQLQQKLFSDNIPDTLYKPLFYLSKYAEKQTGDSNLNPSKFNVTLNSTVVRFINDKIKKLSQTEKARICKGLFDDLLPYSLMNYDYMRDLLNTIIEYLPGDFPQSFLTSLYDMDVKTFFSTYTRDEARLKIFIKVSPMFERCALYKILSFVSIYRNFECLAFPVFFEAYRYGESINFKDIHRGICGRVSKELITELCLCNQTLYSELCSIITDLWERDTARNPILPALRFSLSYTLKDVKTNDGKLLKFYDSLKNLSDILYGFIERKILISNKNNGDLNENSSSAVIDQDKKGSYILLQDPLVRSSLISYAHYRISKYIRDHTNKVDIDEIAEIFKFLFPFESSDTVKCIVLHIIQIFVKLRDEITEKLDANKDFLIKATRNKPDESTSLLLLFIWEMQYVTIETKIVNEKIRKFVGELLNELSGNYQYPDVHLVYYVTRFNSIHQDMSLDGIDNYIMRWYMNNEFIYIIGGVYFSQSRDENRRNLYDKLKNDSEPITKYPKVHMILEDSLTL